MREIKFRAFDKEDKQIYTVKSLAWENGEIKAVLIKETHVWEDPDNLVLLEYTGLKDRNGKEVYEGDILAGEDLIGVVEFDKCAFILKTTVVIPGDITRPEQYYAPFLHSIRHYLSHELEVIGNIYENPDLLEQK